MSRNPASDPVTTGNHGPVWSVAVPGVLRGDMVRVELVGSCAFVDVVIPVGVARSAAQYADRNGANARMVVELTIDDLRALVGVVAQWPGVVRE